MEERLGAKNLIPREGEIWEHFGGIQVVIVALALSRIQGHEGTDMVVYRSLFDGNVSVRTLESFLETVYKSRTRHSRYRRVAD